MQKANTTKPTIFVSHSKRGLFYYNDASARYRCVFPAEEIIANGGQAHAIHFSQINKIQLDNYRKIIFHRPQYSFKLAKIVKQAQKQGIELWVDFDDLLFCPELSDSSAAVQSGKMSPSLAKKHAERYRNALELFDNCQVSTDELNDQLKARINRHFNIKVSYNKVPERWVKQAGTIPTEERLKKKIIRYLPGTSHHKHDFAHVEKFLAELLQENPNYHLNIIGDLEFDTSLFPSKQISQTDFQPYEQLPSVINDSWIIIAPLVDNVFNRCKSGLKFWEAGAFGIPVISSPLRDIERFGNKGLYISDNSKEWEKYIRLLEDFTHYNDASSQAKQASISCVFQQNNTNHRLTYLEFTVKFGPRWPALFLNPCQANKENLSLASSKLLDKELLNQARNAINKDTQPKSNIRLRKLKKLKNSPIQFFLDINHKKIRAKKVDR